MEIFALKDLTFTYPDQTKPAVNKVSATIKRGEFVVLCGATGSGKSTLLRLLKRELAPRGTHAGEILYNGTKQQDLDARTAASEIGFVLQHPEQQLVTDKVWHELSFALENLGYPRDVISRRVAEMASYFGIEAFFDQDVHSLSGGQKQLLNLASIMVLQPRVLLLDEPTAQLDPIAASNFIHTLQKLNRELSVTIIIAEHRLEELIPACDRVLIMEQGALVADLPPQKITAALSPDAPLLPAMPAALRIRLALDTLPVADAPCPLTEREGRKYIETNFNNTTPSLPKKAFLPQGDAVLQVKQAFFRYERHTPDILRGLTLRVHRGESLCILGGNGAGKTTLLHILAGMLHCYSGSVELFGKNIRSYKKGELYRNCVAILPQDVQTLLMRDTVREELQGCEEAERLLPYSLAHLYDRHPYDLSGGEQQLVALARVLSTAPRLLLLDEPTKGLDASAKQGILQIIKTLTNRGMTVVTVTHDVEFAALCSDRAAMFFRGEITSVAEPSIFFSENSFYTTAAARMSRDHFSGAVTVDDVVALCRINGRREGNA